MIFLRDDTIDDTVAAIAHLLYNENSSVRCFPSVSGLDY